MINQVEKKNPKRRFKEFLGKENWNVHTLGTVLMSMYNGQTPSRSKGEYWNGKINWLTSGELNCGIVNDTFEKITELGLDSAKLKIIPKGILVIAITGLEASGTRGNCAILGCNTTLNQSCMALFPIRSLISSDFLFYWYLFIGDYYGIKYTQGTKQQSYNAKILNDLEILIPSLDEQNKISSFFSKLDSMIDFQKRKLDKLEATKKALLQEIFPEEGQDKPKRRFKGFTGAWEQRKLGSIGSTYTGLSGKTKEDFGHGEAQYITYLNVFQNTVSDITMTDKVEIDTTQNEVKYGDVLFTTSSETPEEVGMSSVWLGHMPNIYLNSFCFGFRPNQKIDPYFLGYSLRAPYMRDKIKILAQGISRYNISKNKVMELEISLPNNEEQRLLGNFLRNIDLSITLHQRKLDKLKNLKQAYLNEMFV